MCVCVCVYMCVCVYIYIYHNTVSLYNVHSYMFRHLCVILRQFKKLQLSTEFIVSLSDGQVIS